ncbi:MAG TPA: hypothetical protein VI669_16150 [Vicinamibacteria bacterium]
MLPRLAAVLLMAAGLRGCLTYEYEHEFWLRVDGSGTVHVTGRPELWTAFKGLGDPQDPATVTPEAARALFRKAGLEITRARITRRGGRPYLFVSADFKDVNALSGSAAFPDLRIALVREGERLRLRGEWRRPPTNALALGATDGLLAVRFHLPSKLYEHQNAPDGVERGNIVGWRQDVTAGLHGGPLVFGALMDERSILSSTVVLFGGAIVLAALILSLGVYAVQRRGRRDLTREKGGGPPPRV